MRNTFNIVNHEGPPRKIDLMPRVTKEMKASRSYNMLTNSPHSAHDATPTLYDEEYALAKFVPPTYRVKTGKGQSRQRIAVREAQILKNQANQHKKIAHQ